MNFGSAVFETWAPFASPWSAWAKPVLFAWNGALDLIAADGAAQAAAPPITLPTPASPAACAWIIDVEGSLAVRTGAALARQGVRPVPLFNGVPDHVAVIPVAPIINALAQEAASLPAVPADAPPAFLLDSRRMHPLQAPRPGTFDNRWQIAPQDFPSANRLLAAGITDVVVVTAAVLPDLAHVLRRWQDAGVRLHQVIPGDPQQHALNVPPPPKFRSIWWRVLVLAGLSANSAGGFGAMVPVPSQSSGYG